MPHLHLCVIFSFFKILIFRVVSEVKGKNWSKMTKYLVRHAPYHTSYDCYMAHVCKIIISPSFFFIVSKLGFFGLCVCVCGWEGGGRGKRAKSSPKLQKNMLVVLHISGTIHHVIVIYGTDLLNDNISRHFLHFSKF